MQNTDENLVFCAAQLKRLEGLDFFSSLGATAVKELRDTLIRACPDTETAKAVVDRWLLERRDRPVPKDFYDMAHAAVAARDLAAIQSCCDECAQLDGFVRRERIVSFVGSSDPQIVTAVDFCTCPRGQSKRAAFRRYDAARRAEEEAAKDLGKVEPQGLPC